VREFDPYFMLKHDAVDLAAFSSIQKCTVDIRILAYGAHADAHDPGLYIREMHTSFLYY
jgi:hypothetical protein